ncbi:MAG: class GN sortase [Cognaticolwellia sp.]
MGKITAAALLLVGSLLCINACWLPAKAWLSQQLIHYSWQQAMAIKTSRLDSQGSQVVIKPWPWADTFPIAELTFQRLKKNIVVLNGGDPTTLAFSAGAVAPYNQTHASKPFVVAGHRDSHFAFLADVILKDVIDLTNSRGQAKKYQVQSIDIVDASLGQLPLPADESMLVLITCYPFNGLNSNANQRYVIYAKAI